MLRTIKRDKNKDLIYEEIFVFLVCRNLNTIQPSLNSIDEELIGICIDRIGSFSVLTNLGLHRV